MDIKEKFSKKFDELVKEGTNVLSNCGWDGKNLNHFPNNIEYFRFRTEALNLLRKTCGENSDHYRELNRIANAKDSANNAYYFQHSLGVVEAAKRDFEGGMLFDPRSIIAAEVFDDFIEQAESLLEKGFYVPAASLAGAVLEDTLRKLCQSNNVPMAEKTKIDRLNADLAKAEVYDKLILKRITALADIRNNADHGHFDKFKKEDVEDMVKWLRRFMADNLH